MSATVGTPLLLAYAAAVCTLLSGAVSLLATRRHPGFLHFGSFLFLFFSGAASIGAGGWALLAKLTATDRFALGLPWLDWHVRIDPLSGFFLVLLGTLVVAISLYGPSYTREFTRGPAAQPLPPLGVFTALFILGMQVLLLADDALVFMIFWEMMSLSGYFLVVYQHQHAANRHAAFLYLLLAHVGALVILLSFGVLAAFGGGLTFDQMRAAKLTPLWATIAFGCAFIGFGIKAGMVPLHVWLPDAHPVAPSHISAHDERSDDQDGHLRHRARELRSDRRRALGMGGGGAHHRHRLVSARRAVRAHAARSQAPARLSLDREHRHHPDGPRAVDDFSRHRAQDARHARAGGGALSHAQPRAVQGAAVSRRRSGALPHA